MRREGLAEQSLGMQSTAPYQALHSYPLMITHTHSLTSPKCLSKMSLRDSFHANYGSSSFSVPFMPSPSHSPASVSSFICALYHLPLHLSLSLFFNLNASFHLLSSFHFTQLLFSFPQVLEHTFTDKSIICLQIKHAQHKLGWESGQILQGSAIEQPHCCFLSLLLFPNFNRLYILSFKNKCRLKRESKHRDKNVFKLI